MSNQTNYVKMNVEFLAEGISPAELVVYFGDFLKQKTQLVSQTGRAVDIEIVESNFSSIVQCDDNEREFLDVKGNLILNEEEIQEAINLGLFGEQIK